MGTIATAFMVMVCWMFLPAAIICTLVRDAMNTQPPWDPAVFVGGAWFLFAFGVLWAILSVKGKEG